MNRIVILTQHRELFAFVSHALTREGYRVLIMDELRPSLARIGKLVPDILVVDAEESLSAAEELCLRLRYHLILGNIRFLIVRPESEPLTGQVSTLAPEVYVERPLHPVSFIAQIQASMDSREVDQSSSQIVVRDLVIDPASFRVTKGGCVLALTLSEFRLLYYLAAHPEMVCRRDRLLNVIWEKSNVGPRTVDVFVRRLRQKIEEDPDRPRFIRSVRAQGYCFHIPGELSIVPSSRVGA